jgi:NADPH2:quinone reductase
MKAWLIDALDGIDKLRLAEVPDPQPGAGEVLLDVTFAALNPADRYLAEGQYPARPTLPHILGRDGVGIVRQIGPGVSGFQVGEPYTILRGEVGIERPGTFAEKVVAPIESLVPIPSGWSLEQAACATLVYLTAHQALTQWGELPPSIVLVTGASGGVGVAAVQLGSAMGHTVIGLSRSSSKREELQKLGAAAAFDPHDPQWHRQVKDFLKGRRVDLAIDNIGGPLFSEMLDTLGEWGKVSVVGRLAGPVPQFNTASLFFRRLRIGGVAVGSYTNAESRAAWTTILAALDRRNAKPVIDRVFPFDQLPVAFARLAEGPMGKVLLRLPASA